MARTEGLPSTNAAGKLSYHSAVVYDQPGEISTAVKKIQTPTPGVDEVLINITHSGICHSDLAVMTKSWGPVAKDQVGGHEGVGAVAAIGPTTTSLGLKIGDRVGVKWMSSVCSKCTPCLEGRDGCCIDGKISGFGVPGTFQQYVLAPAHYVTSIPDFVPSEIAAPLLCGGVTVHAALRKSGAQRGDTIVIMGAGGGLGHLAIQIAAKGMGLRVIAVDAAQKEELCRSCGAESFLDLGRYINDPKSMVSDVMVMTSTDMGVAAVIVCAANNAAYSQALGLLKAGGTLVCVGVPKSGGEPIEGSDPASMVAKELRIVGSTVGNSGDATAVLEMAAKGLVVPTITIVSKHKLTDVFNELSKGLLHGRAVLDLSAE